MPVLAASGCRLHEHTFQKQCNRWLAYEKEILYDRYHSLFYGTVREEAGSEGCKVLLI